MIVIVASLLSAPVSNTGKSNSNQTTSGVFSHFHLLFSSFFKCWCHQNLMYLLIWPPTPRTKSLSSISCSLLLSKHTHIFYLFFLHHTPTQKVGKKPCSNLHNTKVESSSFLTIFPFASLLYLLLLLSWSSASFLVVVFFFFLKLSLIRLSLYFI